MTFRAEELAKILGRTPAAIAQEGLGCGRVARPEAVTDLNMNARPLFTIAWLLVSVAFVALGLAAIVLVNMGRSVATHLRMGQMRQ